MPTETFPLESFFHQTVRGSFIYKIGLNDPEMIDYVTRVLCALSDSAHLFPLKDAAGNPIQNVTDMLHAADPVYGTAASFDEERSVRRYIGDYALFVAGMRLDVMESAVNYHADRVAVDELIRVGKESYSIVSQFDMFEYKKEAPLFARLADDLERCILGIALVREELNERLAIASAQS